MKVAIFPYLGQRTWRAPYIKNLLPSLSKNLYGRFEPRLSGSEPNAKLCKVCF